MSDHQDPLTDMETTNGNIEQDTDKLRGLEAIFNIGSTNVFGTTDPKVFDENLERMGMVDLQNLAAKVGVNKFLAAPEIKSSLRRAFASSMRNCAGTLNIPKPTPVNRFDPKNPKHLELMKALGIKTF